MAKKPQRNFRKYLKGRVSHDMSLTTLASETVVSQVLSDVLTEKAWLSSVKATWSLADFTPQAGDGPIEVGVAHFDYTDAEIEEWVENQGSWEEADMIGQEIANRRIRSIGTFTSPASVSTEIVALNDGNPIHTKCGWQLTTAQTLRIWAYNHGSSALATTVPIVTTAGHCNLWPN